LPLLLLPKNNPPADLIGALAIAEQTLGVISCDFGAVWNRQER
jgi:hypothetical protein